MLIQTICSTWLSYPSSCHSEHRRSILSPTYLSQSYSGALLSRKCIYIYVYVYVCEGLLQVPLCCFCFDSVVAHNEFTYVCSQYFFSPSIDVTSNTSCLASVFVPHFLCFAHLFSHLPFTSLLYVPGFWGYHLSLSLSLSISSLPYRSCITS